MQGQAQVIDYLKELLRGELAARDQYFLHSRMYQDWGFDKLFTRLDHEMEEETQHADALLQRILFLEGTPDMSPEPINPGNDVPSMLRSDLALEYKVRAALAKGIALAEQLGDYQTRDILKLQLQDTEEDHAYWLEKQLGLIDRIGLQNYLQSQAQGV
ncbi:bacterioferritin [Pseudomonas sp. ABC1]|uniref:bacterioferritin n=1 Tax=Pseudomonas sp. ABC1 TaxID=2748080 RepID=UPI0015C3A9B2|nr:bacterioferritin [Pseudomonas sp. ABC1]QLF93078.1 bacterioferritin [Pseudomonas sp. ABC1]